MGRTISFTRLCSDTERHRCSLARALVLHSRTAFDPYHRIGLKGGAYEHIAISYQKKLARAHAKLDIRYTEGGVADNVALVKDRRSGVDAAFLFGGYTNSEQSPQLASMGSVDYVPIWVFYRNSEPLDQLAQLKGKRIAVAKRSMPWRFKSSAQTASLLTTQRYCRFLVQRCQGTKKWRGGCLLSAH